MLRDKNADKRLEYNRNIVDVENKIDEIYEQKRYLNRCLENYDNEMNWTFARLQEINAEGVQEGSFAAQWNERSDQSRKSYMSKFINNQEKEIRYATSKDIVYYEIAREKLQQERDELEWD